MTDKRRILIIDDEQDIVILFKQVLEESGFAVLCAPDGTVGLDMAASNAVDLILLDVHMPGISGLSVLRKLRENERTKSVPVIFLTGSPMDVDQIVEAIDLNPSDFVTKSISAKELIARIQWAFRKQSL